MHWQDYTQLFCFIVLLLVLSYPFGLYIYKIAQKEKTIFSSIFRPAEMLIYKLCGVEQEESQSWLKYSVNLVLFSFFSWFGNRNKIQWGYRRCRGNYLRILNLGNAFIGSD